MPLFDLLDKSRTVGALEVKAPTVRSFFRALEVFGAEIGVVREAARKVPGGLSPDIAASPFLAAAGDGRLEYVLGSEDAEVVAEVAKYVVRVAPQIDSLLGVPGQEGEDDDDDVEPGVLLVLGCAERFHIDPMTVMEWPLGLFLDSLRAYSRPPRQQHSDANEMIGSIIPTQQADGGAEMVS